MELPGHTLAEPTVTVGVGNAFTVIACVAVVVHVPLTPVTVYVLVTVVVVTTAAPVVALKLVAGDHL